MTTRPYVLGVFTWAALAALTAITPSPALGQAKNSKKNIEQEIEFRLGVREQPGGKKLSGDASVFVVKQPGLGARFRRPSLIDLLGSPQKLFNIISNGVLAQSAPKADMMVPVGHLVRLTNVRATGKGEAFYLELMTIATYPTKDDAGKQTDSPALAFVYFDCANELRDENYDAILESVHRWLAPYASRSGVKGFVHSRYTISFPSSWQVQGNQYSAVMAGPKEAFTKNGLLKGVLISSFQPRSTQAGAGEEVFRLLIEELRRSNPHLQAGAIEGLPVSGGIGKATELTGVLKAKDVTLQEHDWLVAAPRKDGSWLYLVFISSDADYSQMRSGFEQILVSLEATDIVGRNETVAAGPAIAVQQPGAPPERNAEENSRVAVLVKGQTPEEVEKRLGKPLDRIQLKESLVLIYANEKVIFENGKLVEVSEPSGSKPAADVAPQPVDVTLAIGTQFTVRLSEALDSGSVQPGHQFTATLIDPILVKGREVISPGAPMTGRVIGVRHAYATKLSGRLMLELSGITVDNTPYVISTDPFRLPASGTEGTPRVEVRLDVGAVISLRLSQPLTIKR